MRNRVTRGLVGQPNRSRDRGEDIAVTTQAAADRDPTSSLVLRWSIVAVPAVGVG